MIGKFVNFCLIFFLTLSPTLANESSISVEASVNRTSLSINDILDYKITISGAKGQPSINESFLKDFAIINRSTQQSYQLINNNFFSSQIKSFQLRPNREGTIIIPSTQINIAGKTYETEPISITVSASSTTSIASNSPVTSQKNKNTASNVTSGIPSGGTKDLFILAVLDKSKAYVGEEIIYSIRLYRRFSSLDQLLYQEPKFGMLTEQLERDQNTYTKIHNGIRYYVQEIDRRSLFSYEPGTLTIPSATAEVQINFFYGNKIIKSNDLSVTIMPLPEKNKPANFSGLVGNYSLDVDVNTNALIENKPIAIRLSVEGSGNIKQLSDLTFETDPSIFKVYQSSTNDLITYINSVSGVRHFEYIIVPKRDGTMTLPVFSFSYFEPKSQTYKTITSPTNTVTILDSGESTELLADNDSANTIKQLRQDLRYIKESFELTKQAKPFYKHVFSLFLIISNTLLLLQIIASIVVTTEFYKQLFQAIYHKPNKKAVANLVALKAKNDWNITDLQQTLFHYLSSIIKRPAQGLPVTELLEELSNKQVESAILSDLKALFDQCSFLAYAPDSANSSSKNDICDKAIDIIQRMNA